MPSELADLGLKTTGDEMDTIARYVEHPYFLRSLTQSGSYPGPSTETSAGQVGLQLQTLLDQKSKMISGIDSRQKYDIPNLQLAPPPRPKGNSANDIYESLDARDQDIRKGMYICVYGVTVMLKMDNNGLKFRSELIILAVIFLCSVNIIQIVLLLFCSYGKTNITY